jgi:hypothetical protein
VGSHYVDMPKLVSLTSTLGLLAELSHPILYKVARIPVELDVPDLKHKVCCCPNRYCLSPPRINLASTSLML